MDEWMDEIMMMMMVDRNGHIDEGMMIMVDRYGDDDSDSGDDSDSDEDGDSNDDEDGDGNEIKVLFTTIITLSTIYGIIIIIISWSFLQTSSSLNLSR